MRRFDHAPFFSMQQDAYTIPFYVKNDVSDEAVLEKKKFLNNPMRFVLKNIIVLVIQ